jgi:Helicase conserved C-terminal domain
MTTIQELEALLGFKFFDYQRTAIVKASSWNHVLTPRRCLFYKTGAGKTYTALAQMRVLGVQDVLVITPPITFEAWSKAGQMFGLQVECMSHAKFRMKSTKVSRTKAIIADEMHMFGGHSGQGWKKLDKIALHLQAPLIMASATPNYNDADRVYCIQHILDPQGTKGGFLDFIYQNCTTEANPYGMYPVVTGFHRYANAAEYLADLKCVDYLPDDLVYTIIDIPVTRYVPAAMSRYGLNRRKGRIIASSMEERHAVVDHTYIDITDELKGVVLQRLWPLLESTPVLIFANHSTVAEAAMEALNSGDRICDLITGTTSRKKKAASAQAFRRGETDILIGTASLATGTDGFDKICDTMIILDDTDDDSLRRQLIGRIMPRGVDTDATKKKVYRLVPT